MIVFKTIFFLLIWWKKHKKCVKIYYRRYGDNMKKREIPKKNYLILLAIIVAVVGLCFYLMSWYKTIEEYYKTNSVISEVLPEIETETFSSFLLDNPDIIVYISSSSDSSVKTFEKQFKRLIVEYSLNSNIIYFDTDKETNVNGLETLVSNYMSKSLKKVTNIPVPNLIRFENGEIVDMLYVKNSTITKNDVIKFLERNEVIEND